MEETTDGYQASSGAGYAIMGVLALLLASGLLGAAEEETAFVMGGVAAGGAGLYLLVAGGVARGIQLARLPRPSSQPSSQASPQAPPTVQGPRPRGPQI